MNSIIYLIGLVVVVLFILSVLVSMYGNLRRNNAGNYHVANGRTFDHDHPPLSPILTSTPSLSLSRMWRDRPS